MKSIIRKTVVAALAVSVLNLSSIAARADVVDTDSLYEGQSVTYTVYLCAGDVVSYAVRADEDAYDVDLAAISSLGELMASDTDMDANPVVVFVAPYTGTYTIMVEMVDTRGGTWSAYQLIRL